MPTTIPYDPSLILGNVVNMAHIAHLKEKADALDVDDSVKKLNDEIVAAAKDFAKEKIACQETLKKIKSTKSVNVQVESPIDYLKSQIKTMPLAVDSLNMNVQYFSAEMQGQEEDTLARTVSAFVSSSTKFLGNEAKTQLGAAAAKQVSQQVSKHSVRGTLVLAVSCTHKNASILAPFVFNVDKAVRVWNHLYKDDLIDTSAKGLSKLVTKQDIDGKNKLSLVSGMTYGSTFVGMVHILDTARTDVSESLSSVVASLQKQMDAGAWFQKASGGYGVDASISESVKSLLSTHEISSHVTMLSMGVIPSFVASDLKMGIDRFAEFSPQTSMQAIASLQNDTRADHDSVKQSADAARKGEQMINLKGGQIKSALSALAHIDGAANKVLDINSMMKAFDDYLKKATEGNSGVPINYYLKDLTKGMIAEMWVAKYFPNQYMTISNDDSASAPPTATPTAPTKTPEAQEKKPE
ncbi:hypothetical protein N7454_007851 [Penicillium verhagenii]|nr:hypothetical protein N7454_007851 [Penicillium verhagenii]